MACRQPKSVDGVPLAVLKRRAHGRVRSQIKAGLLIKPETCEICGRAPGRGRDGRSLLQAHHHKGYAFPLDVQWLCVGCHRAETPCCPCRGESSTSAKLTEAAVRDIRTSPLPGRQMAAQYGVTPRLILMVRQRKGWAHVS